MDAARAPGPGSTAVFAAADWYLERDEPERVWRGVLRRRPPAGGPADRPSLAFELVTAEGPIPAYAAGVEPLLGGFEERAVVVRAKLVDLGSEGFAPELWIGTLEADGPATDEPGAGDTRPGPDDARPGPDEAEADGAAREEP